MGLPTSNEIGYFSKERNLKREDKMDFFDVKELPKKEIKKGIWLRSVFLENIMLTYVEFEPNVEFPSHKHPHEQITLILEGKIEFNLRDETKILKAGEGIAVPPNTEHSICALSRVRVVDAWNPVREDYVVS